MNFLYKIVGIGALIILIFNVVNMLIFNFSIPDKFNNATWKGKWKSSSFSLIGGKIIANLPEEIPNNEVFEVDAMIYYNIWSIYKMGGIKEFKLVGTLGEGQNIAKENRTLKSSPSFNFKAKVLGIGNQELDYSGISDRNKTVIVGGYKSLHPKDFGNFTIAKN